MHFSSAKSRSATPDINVTPLVDVVLVLLIIFMVVAPLLSKQLWLNLPEKTNPSAPADPSEKKDPPFVWVKADGSVDVNGSTTEMIRLAAVVRPLLGSDGTLRFRADDESPYSTVVSVLELVKSLGAKNVTVEPDKRP